jgi:predicted RNA-binding protein with PUA-like domain
MGTASSFFRAKRLERQADYYDPSSAEVKNKWSLIFIFLMHRDSLTYHLHYTY